MADQGLIPIAPEVATFIGRHHGLFIEGLSVEATSGQLIDVRNPADGGVIAAAALASGWASPVAAFSGCWASRPPVSAHC